MLMEARDHHLLHAASDDGLHLRAQAVQVQAVQVPTDIALIHSDDVDDDQGELKPPLACQSCRASKVRCQQPNRNSSCVRCEKAGRPCTPSSGVVKRQRRPRNAVAELQTKVDALTHSLQMQIDGGTGHSNLENVPRGSISGKAPGGFFASSSSTNSTGTSEVSQSAFPLDYSRVMNTPLTTPSLKSPQGSVFRLSGQPACFFMVPC